MTKFCHAPGHLVPPLRVNGAVGGSIHGASSRWLEDQSKDFVSEVGRQTISCYLFDEIIVCK